jgi:hypothetical protein
MANYYNYKYNYIIFYNTNLRSEFKYAVLLAPSKETDIELNL